MKNLVTISILELMVSLDSSWKKMLFIEFELLILFFKQKFLTCISQHLLHHFLYLQDISIESF